LLKLQNRVHSKVPTSLKLKVGLQETPKRLPGIPACLCLWHGS